jgi:hypothetical protein
MIVKFQIILEGVTPLKIQCVDKFPDEKMEAERTHYLIKGFSEYSENLFESKNKKELIIFENIKNLKYSKYKHYCLKSAYERFVQGRERY